MQGFARAGGDGYRAKPLSRHGHSASAETASGIPLTAAGAATRETRANPFISMSNVTSASPQTRSSRDANTLESAARGESPHAPRPYAHRQAAGQHLQTVPHRMGVYDVAPDVVGLKTAIANVFFIGAPGREGWVLVDAGMPGYAESIIAFAERRFGKTPPAAIVLTHAHFDHVGSIEALLAEWDVPVYAHRAELPFITGRSAYPPPDPTAGGGAMAWMSFVYSRAPLNLHGRAQVLPEDGSIPVLPDWRWIATPGHTPGHVSLFRDDDRTLIAGDAFVTIKAESLIANLTLAPRVHRPPAYFTPDWPAARVSIVKLAELLPNVVATGHGIPLHGEEMRRELLRLGYEFERLGLPATGRYRDIPALYNESTGLFRVPPPPISTAAVLGLSLLAGFALGRGVRKAASDD
jgi:glyoxylase-like metal-dependent hydrolase (beta-lactamase superfamily II)